jgi:putative YhbY family RNA-binding protein
MLTPAQRQVLKGKAHKLRPLVIIGGKGLSPEVIAEIEAALKAHELIKLRAPGLERDALENLLQEISLLTDSEPVQRIGKILVIYRKRPEAEP